MNYLKKMSALLAMIEQEHTNGIINANITYANFMRLVDGDLKHIGDANRVAEAMNKLIGV